MHFNYRWVATVVLLGGLLFQSLANAQAVTDPLTTWVNSGAYAYNRLERLSAVANQATYNNLLNTCGNLQAPSGACPAATFRVFKITEELVHSANELLGSGPTQYSLRVDAEGLGFDLRWTAAEELSAPGSASTEFANTQIASVISRITALRFGAANDSFAVTDAPARGGSAGDDAGGLLANRLGVYLNSGYGYGKRHPTELEDAFAFDGKNFTLGADYRFTPRLVFGGMIGHDNQRIDFDSTQSVVAGNIKATGTGLTLYGMYEWEGPYVDLALGWQRLSIDSLRDITYPSFNTTVESVSARATGKTHSTNTVGTFDFGWPINIEAFGIDPDLRVEYRHIAIDGFGENSFYTGGTRTGQPAGYGFTYGDQSVKSLEAAVGIKLRYVLRPSFGVVIPYVKAEFHHKFDANPFTVSATYDGLNSGSASFDLPSDPQTKNFKTYSGGFSMVLPHGWQVFAQYQGTSGISYLSHHIVSGGIRGEF